MSLVIPYSDACERNKDPILEVISPYLENASRVLEIGSGTGQHAVYFADQYPHLQWQTSDQVEYLHGLQAQLGNAQVVNALMPIELNVNQPIWKVSPPAYDVIYTANTFHIMCWQEICAFFAGLGQVAAPQAILIVYGPFTYGGKFTSDSNRAFDQSLRSRGVGSAIRDFEAVQALATKHSFAFVKDHPMPANNQCLVWRRHGEHK